MISEGGAVVDSDGISHRVDAVFPHHRGDDGELVGWIAMTDDGLFVPIDRLHRAGACFDVLNDAERSLEAVGLRMLAQTWWLPGEDGSSIPVGFVELTETTAIVAPLLEESSAHVAKALDLTRRVVLELPCERLVSARI